MGMKGATAVAQRGSRVSSTERAAGTVFAHRPGLWHFCPNRLGSLRLSVNAEVKLDHP